MLWLAHALAHPLGGVLPSHDVLVTVEEDRIEVVYGARLPTHDVLQDIGEQAEFGPEQAAVYNEARLLELRENLQLRVDGERVPWDEAAPTEQSGTGNSRFVLFEQVLGAPFDGGELTLSNGNQPDQLSYFRNEVLVGPWWVVSACSMWERVGEGVEKSSNATWRLDEPSRELHLTARRAAWHERPRIEGERSVDEALPPAPPWTWAVGGAAVLLAGALGLRTARRRPASPPA